MRPLSSTIMRSQCRMVESLCAMTSRVQLSESRLSLTCFCEMLSSAEVASSKNIICGWPISARAMSSRCFCPPLNPALPSTTTVCSPIGIRFTSFSMSAILSASQASSCVAHGAVMVMLWKRSPVKRLPFCRQHPIFRLRLVLSTFERSWLS